jgi:curved DNA-binding protein CbpA
MLKTARNKKIKQWHPDRFKGNNELANEMCGRINNAYDLLKNLIE